jgi:hypothetical protein
MIQNRRFVPSGVDSGNGGDTVQYATRIANNWANYREKNGIKGLGGKTAENPQPAINPGFSQIKENPGKASFTIDPQTGERIPSKTNAPPSPTVPGTRDLKTPEPFADEEPPPINQKQQIKPAPGAPVITDEFASSARADRMSEALLSQANETDDLAEIDRPKGDLVESKDQSGLRAG